MASLAFKDARMELKTTSKVKELLNSAALLAGQDLTAFVLASAQERAKTVLSEHQVLNLSREEQVNFMRAFSEQSKPTNSLKELMSAEGLVER